MTQVQVKLAVLRGPQGAPGTIPPTLRLVTINPTPIAQGVVALPSPPAGDVVWNMAQVFLDLTGADFTASGGLKGDRPYLAEEHTNVVAQGQTAVFQDGDASLDGKYAVLTYLSV